MMLKRTPLMAQFSDRGGTSSARSKSLRECNAVVLFSSKITLNDVIARRINKRLAEVCRKSQSIDVETTTDLTQASSADIAVIPFYTLTEEKAHRIAKTLKELNPQIKVIALGLFVPNPLVKIGQIDGFLTSEDIFADLHMGRILIQIINQ